MEPEYPEYPEPSQRGKSANLLEPFKSVRLPWANFQRRGSLFASEL